MQEFILNHLQRLKYYIVFAFVVCALILVAIVFKNENSVKNISSKDLAFSVEHPEYLTLKEC